MTPARVVRPIPLFDEHGRQVRVVKPGSRCFLVSEFDGPSTGHAVPKRAMVRFPFDFADGVTWDVDRGSISTEPVKLEAVGDAR